MARYLHIKPSEVDQMEPSLIYALLDAFHEDVKNQEQAMKNAR